MGTMNQIEKAIKAAGGPTAFAKLFSSTPQAVTNWRKRGVPAKRVLVVEKITGISRYELRPELHGDAE